MLNTHIDAIQNNSHVNLNTEFEHNEISDEIYGSHSNKWQHLAHYTRYRPEDFIVAAVAT